MGFFVIRVPVLAHTLANYFFPVLDWKKKWRMDEVGGQVSMLIAIAAGLAILAKTPRRRVPCW